MSMYFASIRQENLNTVIHVGAGFCSELRTYLRQGAKLVVLIEPYPKLANYLRLKTEHIDNVRIIQAAVGKGPGNATLKIFNSLIESGLITPEKLLDYCPNLKLAGERKVNVDNLEHLIDLDPGSYKDNNLLVLEPPGMEEEIIESTRPEFLQRFNWIVIRTSKEPLYANGPTSSNLQKILKDRGFDLVAEQFMTPPFEEQVYKRNYSFMYIVTLKNQLSDSIDEIESLKEEVKRKNISINDISKQLHELAQDYDDQVKLVHEKDAACEDLKVREREKSEMIEKLTSARDKLTQHVRKQQLRIKQLENSYKEQAGLVTDLDKKISKITCQWEEQENRDKLLDEEILKAEAQIQLIKDVLLNEK